MEALGGHPARTVHRSARQAQVQLQAEVETGLDKPPWALPQGRGAAAVFLARNPEGGSGLD